ncbi:hypothetical protein CTI12_AA048960 [Artemisia annua]|uniref:Uncharacterized protein n=1 Tax=Artemisia annua TaxID=35608 RepID=A0A2U1PGM4_ARTAN|nr:hypothetical protein CTI12_AA048960 [Artemisia annua]
MVWATEFNRIWPSRSCGRSPDPVTRQIGSIGYSLILVADKVPLISTHNIGPLLILENVEMWEQLTESQKLLVFGKDCYNSRFTVIGGEGKRPKIDRMFVNYKWLEPAPLATLIACDKDESHHVPLRWSKKDQCWGRKPFRFYNGWLEAPTFMKMCKDWWGSYQVEEKADFVLMRKLRALKIWNVQVFCKNKVSYADMAIEHFPELLLNIICQTIGH